MRRLTFFIVLLSACAVSEPWPAHYLSTGIDRVTQDEIIAQLGPRTKPTHYRTEAWNGTMTTVEGARWSAPTEQWAVPLRLNAKNTFSDLIKPASYARGINIWNRPVNHTQHNPSHDLAARG